MGLNHWQVIHHASWFIKKSLSNHCWITNHPNNQSCKLVDWTHEHSMWINHCWIIVKQSITRIINHAVWLIELDWLLEGIINLMRWLINPEYSMWLNHCQIFNHASWLTKPSLSNHCWIINHTNNQSCGLVDWTRLTTRMNNQFDKLFY